MTAAVAAPAPVRAAPRTGLRLAGLVLLAWLLSRAATTALLVGVVRIASPDSRLGAGAGLLDTVTAWDGQWYQLIARQGYPAVLPLFDGATARNAWAFLPAYPALVDALAGGRSPLWPVAAAAVSVAASGIAALLLAVLLRPHVGDRGAMIAVLLFLVSPVAFVLQAAYAESLGLALLFGVLVLVDRRRWLAAVPVVLVLAFTRPGDQAVALLVLGALLVRMLGRRDRPRVGELLRALVLLIVAGVGGWLWPWTAAAATGIPDAYLRTELAWRQAWSGAEFTPVLSWFSSADFWFGSAAGPVVLGVLAASWAALLLSPPGRRLGAVVRLWCGAWTLYLLAVVFPLSSTFRFLLPLAPAGGVLARAPRDVVVLLVLASLAAQALWMYVTLGAPSAYWTVP